MRTPHSLLCSQAAATNSAGTSSCQATPDHCPLSHSTDAKTGMNRAVVDHKFDQLRIYFERQLENVPFVREFGRCLYSGGPSAVLCHC